MVEHDSPEAAVGVVAITIVAGRIRAIDIVADPVKLSRTRPRLSA